MARMKRLGIVWSKVAVWLMSWVRSARIAREAADAVRDMQRELNTERGTARQTTQGADSLRNEIAELRQDVAHRDVEIERLQNKIDLLETALEFQVRWREKEVERMRAEAAIHTRRRVEAVSGENPTFLQSES